jgi:hypothetical protein
MRTSRRKRHNKIETKSQTTRAIARDSKAQVGARSHIPKPNAARPTLPKPAPAESSAAPSVLCGVRQARAFAYVRARVHPRRTIMPSSGRNSPATGEGAIAAGSMVPSLVERSGSDDAGLAQRHGHARRPYKARCRYDTPATSEVSVRRERTMTKCVWLQISFAWGCIVSRA